MIVNLGETYIHGLDRKTAQAIFAAVAELGADPRVVRATDSGFVVPNAVADELERMTMPRWADAEAVF